MQNDEYNEKMYKLEVYKTLYTAYADEIRNLWQRSIFLGAFMVLVWSGYGVLQLKFIEKGNSDFNVNLYNYASLGLCAVIMILSLFWVAMAKGSKFVQEAHENHIKDLEFDLFNEIDIDTKKNKRIFCDLDIYNIKLAIDKKISVWYPLKSYRYSPSRINIALGWVSVAISILLGIVHSKAYGWCIVVISIVFILLCFWQILNKN